MALEGMAVNEPVLRVGLLRSEGPVRVFLAGRFSVGDVVVGPGWCLVQGARGLVQVQWEDREVETASPALLTPGLPTHSFTIPSMAVGEGFHWCHREDLTFQGALEILVVDRDLILVNRIGLEDYLESVVSSEMNPSSPRAFLEAHAIVARSWVLHQLQARPLPLPDRPPDADIWEWTDRSSHEHFHLCAEDHCQRYHGRTRVKDSATQAVRATRGVVLEASGQVVDARFSKCCGGITERFGTCWGEPEPPGLASILDAPAQARGEAFRLSEERRARAWIAARPRVFCRLTDPDASHQVLLPMDRSTPDFFRWSVVYSQEQVADLVESRTGAGLGSIVAMEALRRGPSGRIHYLKLMGTKGTLRVGKELAIRRILSRTHLKSSAFFVVALEPVAGIPTRFRLTGAGWGHGVGMCQVGAGAMALAGASAPQILAHYFPEASLTTLY